MVKDRKKVKETIHKVLDKLGDVGVAALTSHPIVMALVLMAASNVSRSFLEPSSRADLMLDGLYIDARNIALASALVPIVPGALNLVGQALATRAAASQ